MEAGVVAVDMVDRAGTLKAGWLRLRGWTDVCRAGRHPALHTFPGTDDLTIARKL